MSKLDVGFGLDAAGRAPASIDLSGTADPEAGVQQVLTTSVGGAVGAYQVAPVSGTVWAKARITGQRCHTSGHARRCQGSYRPRRRWSGGGYKVHGRERRVCVARLASHSGERFPGAGIQLMSKVGELL